MPNRARITTDVPAPRGSATTPASIDDGLLARLVPLNTLTPDQRRGLLARAHIQRLAPGASLPGGHPTCTYYLLEGELDILESCQRVGILAAGTPEARFAVSTLGARARTVRARSPARLLALDRTLVSTLVIWAEACLAKRGGRQAATPDCDTRWISRLLQSELFARIPPGHIERIFQLMDPVPVKAGQDIVCEGQPGRHYYVVCSGHCEVKRTPRGARTPVGIARLREGSTFGEEALVADTPRNATVTMLTDGLLMRLTKASFAALIRDPLLHRVDRATADAMVSRGTRWLDVRVPDEYIRDGLPDSMNLPLADLRERIKRLDDKRSYIVYCDDGQRSAAAAFLLSERGFRVCVLDGGLEAGTAQAVGPSAAASDDAESAGTSPSDPSEQQAPKGRLAEQTSRARGALARARQWKDEIEAAIRAAEGHARRSRAEVEEQCRRVREEARYRLFREQKRLEAEYERAAEEMDAAAAPPKAIREAAEARARGIREQQQAAEERMRDAMELRLDQERHRLETEFAHCMELEERARRVLDRALRAEHAVGQEAEALRHQIDAADVDTPPEAPAGAAAIPPAARPRARGVVPHSWESVAQYCQDRLAPPTPGRPPAPTGRPADVTLPEGTTGDQDDKKRLQVELMGQQFTLSHATLEHQLGEGVNMMEEIRSELEDCRDKAEAWRRYRVNQPGHEDER